MSEHNRDEENRPLPVDDTQRLPVEDETQPLSTLGAPRRLDAETGETRRLPVNDDTRRSDDPLSIFDEPRTTGVPTTGAPTTEQMDAPVNAPVAEPPARSGPRTGTIVWGFLVLALGVGLVADAAGANIDVELAAIVLLALAGAVLVLGSVASAIRRRRT